MNWPARVPLAPARLSPFFFKMKLAPINALDATARISPLEFSDTPISLPINFKNSKISQIIANQDQINSFSPKLRLLDLQSRKWVEEFIHFAPKRPDEQKRQRLELFLSSLCEALSPLWSWQVFLWLGSFFPSLAFYLKFPIRRSKDYVFHVRIFKSARRC